MRRRMVLQERQQQQQNNDGSVSKSNTKNDTVNLLKNVHQKKRSMISRVPIIMYGVTTVLLFLSGIQTTFVAPVSAGVSIAVQICFS